MYNVNKIYVSSNSATEILRQYRVLDYLFSTNVWFILIAFRFWRVFCFVLKIMCHKSVCF